MPRVARLYSVGVVHHVISRFVDRSWQLSDDEERHNYLRRLDYALRRSDWTLLAYALMSNHVHLVLESGNEPLAGWSKSAHSSMARWLNQRHGRLGPVFADRPYAEALEPGRVPFVIAYVHNNPVRAKLTVTAAGSSWTSHSAYLGSSPPQPPVAVTRGLSLCGYSPDRAGRRAFDDWVRGCSKEALTHPPQDLNATQREARRQLGATVILGTPILRAEGRCVPILAPVRRPLVLNLGRVTTDAVLAAVHTTVGADPRGRCGRDPRPEVREARRVALTVWEQTGQARVHMARALGIAESSACNLLHRNVARIPAEKLERVIGSLKES